MTTSTIHRLTNGYSVTSMGDLGAGASMESNYAATIAEAVFWVGQAMGVTSTEAKRKDSKRAAVAPKGPDDLLEPSDPMLSQVSTVFPLTGGGFITRAEMNVRLNTQAVEVHCVSMDDVANTLTQIYSYVPPEPVPPVQPPVTRARE